MIFLNPNSDWPWLMILWVWRLYLFFFLLFLRKKALLSSHASCWSWAGVRSTRPISSRYYLKNTMYNPWARQIALSTGRIRWPPIGRRRRCSWSGCMQLTGRKKSKEMDGHGRQEMTSSRRRRLEGNAQMQMWAYNSRTRSPPIIQLPPCMIC